MNITYIVNVFPKLSETFVLDQITYLIDQGHHVNIIAETDWHEPETHADVDKYDLRSKTIYLPKNNYYPGFEITGELIQTLLFSDIIHAHFATWPAETAMKIAKLTGIPFVFTAHAYDIFIDPDIGRLARMAESASKILTVTEYNKNYLLGLIGESYRDKIKIVRCAINTNKLQPLENKTNEKTIILICGRFVEKKGITYALKAFAQVSDKTDVELRIIGDGPLSDEIAAEIKQLEIGDNVKLLGALPHSAVLNQIKNSDIFLLPSVTSTEGDREGLPVSILEAQALGIPVISTIHTGIPEGVIDGETAFLVQERAVEEITEKLELLIQSPNVRKKMGEMGHKFIYENFNSETEFPKLEQLLQRLADAQEYHLQILTQDKDSLTNRIKSLLNALYFQKKEKVIDQSKLIEKMKDIIRQKDDHILQKKQQIKRTEGWLHEKIETIELLQKKVAVLGQTIDARQDQIDRTYKTLSWKITAPLRFIFSSITATKNYIISSFTAMKAGLFEFFTIVAKQRQKAHIAFCPDWSNSNAYQSLLYKALSKHGYSAKGISAKQFSIFWILLNITKTKIIHLHWLNGIYDSDRAKTFPHENAFWFRVRIFFAKVLGYKIIWTVHNLVSHECTDPEAENSVRRFVAKLAHTVIVHCEYAKKMAQQQWEIPESKIHVCPHGTYINNYPDTVSKDEARKFLEVDNSAFTFLFLGMIRAYKGLSTLIDCFSELQKKYPQIKLIVAGNPFDAAAEKETAKISNCEGVYPFLRFIPDDEIQYFFHAADIAVLPYQKILTSGAVYLSLSFGVPVIVPNSGCIPEIIDDKTGYIYDGSPKGLSKAMIQAIEDQAMEKMHYQAKELAQRLHWDNIVSQYYLPIMPTIQQKTQK